jgi:hypothetical protein
MFSCVEFDSIRDNQDFTAVNRQVYCITYFFLFIFNLSLELNGNIIMKLFAVVFRMFKG